MATSTINHHSHWNTTADTAPQQSNRSEAAARDVYSPWAQIGQSESNTQVVHFSDCSLSEQVDGCAFESDPNSNGAKKTVWNKPSNGAADVSPVMGALSWPALSDSTKASFKSSSSSSSSDSLRTLPNGSVSEAQVTGMASASHRQANTNNANPNTMLNHVVPSRQRSMKRGGGNSNHNASANGVFSQQQAHGFEVETVNNSGKSGNYGAEFSSRDNNRRDGGQWGGFGAQSHGGNDHQHQRNANRRGIVGPHLRGDGTYHNGYGGRRDQERQNQDWKPHRGWGNRDAHMQPQRGPARPFMGAPPHTSPPYIPGPMPVQPYQPPMVYSEVPPVFYFPGPFPDPLRMPMLSPVPPVFVHVPDTQLQIRIVNQMDYYFSNENLIKDTFLRQNMDEHGWVPVTLIAGFKKWRRMINLSGLSGRWTEKSVDILLDQRFFSIIQNNLTYMHAFSILSVVMELTDNIQLILNAVRSSTVVEVQGEKLRRRNDWFHWLMPPSVQNSTVSSPQSLPKSTSDLLVENLQRVAFDDKTATHGNVEARLSRSSSAELNTPSN